VRHTAGLTLQERHPSVAIRNHAAALRRCLARKDAKGFFAGNRPVFARLRMKRRSDPQRAQFTAGAGTLPDLVETAGQLARAGAGMMLRLTIETMAQGAEVVAAGIAGDQGRGRAAVDRVVDLAE